MSPKLFKLRFLSIQTVTIVGISREEIFWNYGLNQSENNNENAVKFFEDLDINVEDATLFDNSNLICALIFVDWIILTAMPTKFLRAAFIFEFTKYTWNRYWNWSSKYSPCSLLQYWFNITILIAILNEEEIKPVQETRLLKLKTKKVSGLLSTKMIL